MNIGYSVGAYRANEMSVRARGRANLGGTRRGILIGHGAGGNALVQFAAANVALPKLLTDCGYPAMSADLGAPAYAGYTFGNDDSITAFGAAWTHMKAATGLACKTDKFLYTGGSMSAQLLLNWAIQGTNAGLVQAAALLVGALDVDDAYQNNIGGLRALIGNAYGVTYPTAIPNLATHSPAAYSNADKAKITFPLKLFTSVDDIYTNTAEAQAWAASVNAQTGLGNVIVEEIPGQTGHSVSLLDNNEVIVFFDANGGRA